MSTPLDGVDLVLADLDGVIYRGPQPIPYAVESMNAIDVPVAYLTNNASRTDVSVAAHLTELGLHTAPERVVTSPQAAARLLAGMVPTGSAILVVGGEGLTTEVGGVQIEPPEVEWGAGGGAGGGDLALTMVLAVLLVALVFRTPLPSASSQRWTK